jgi:hypothetical protein
VTGVQRAAQLALAARLRSLLPPEVVDRFVGGTHTQRFEDSLLPCFSAERVRVIRSQLERGAGGELRPTSSGKRPAHAPYSSAALAANAFGGWIDHETEFRLAGLEGFDVPVSLEHKLKIAHGGGEANLDCAISSPDSLVGVESKLTEYLAPHESVPWRTPYQQPEMAELLDGGWRAVFEASITSTWTPLQLGVEQLIKHALALNSHANGRAPHLVYVFWEPENGDDHQEVVQHRAEIDELASKVVGTHPMFHACSYAELFAEWASLQPDGWRNELVGQLQARYSGVRV